MRGEVRADPGRRGRARRRAAADERAGDEVETSAEVLAHDLREGLGTIALFAWALEARLGDGLDPAAARDLDGIRAGVERMTSLVAGGNGNADWRAAATSHRPLDASLVVRDALANLHARIAETRSEIHCEPLPWIRGDGPQLTRLFQNLVANSLKFRDPMLPARVQIAAEPAGRRWRFEVTDNGIGIAPELAKRSFDPARGRGDATNGEGLGLIICARIIRAHGGQARAERRAAGGTRVTFDLPAA